MTDATRRLGELARRVTAPYLEQPGIRAALLTGSVAEGRADNTSDLDIILYYDALPAEDSLESIRTGNRGGDRLWVLGDRGEGGFAESYPVDGVECQFGHTTIAAWERDMDVVLVDFDTASPNQKALTGLLHGIALHGEDLIGQWRSRAAEYPDGLARAMIADNLGIFPLWTQAHRIISRDATVWIHQMLADGAYRILGMLAGLNRIYYSPFQFKRMREFAGSLEAAPDDLAGRIESLFAGDVEERFYRLENLVADTLDLVERHEPSVDVGTLKAKLGVRRGS